MEMFNRYLDTIKAEDELKEKTKEYVKASLKTNEKKELLFTKEVRIMRKPLVAAVSVAFCAIVLVFGYLFYSKPVNFVSFDVNPSVEIGLNTFDIVVSVEAANEDGEALTSNLKLRWRSVEEAIKALVQEASEQEYIAEDGSTVIALTAESEDEDKALELQNQSEAGANAALQIRNQHAIIYKDVSDLSLRTEAKELGVSPGKFKLIKNLQELYPEISLEELINVKVSEIMIMASEAFRANAAQREQSEDHDDMIQNMVQTANRIQEAKGTMEQEKEQDQNKNQGETRQAKEQEKNQNNTSVETESNENSYTEQEQNKNGNDAEDKGSDNGAQVGIGGSTGSGNGNGGKGN